MPQCGLMVKGSRLCANSSPEPRVVSHTVCVLLTFTLIETVKAFDSHVTDDNNSMCLILYSLMCVCSHMGTVKVTDLHVHIRALKHRNCQCKSCVFTV